MPIKTGDLESAKGFATEQVPAANYIPFAVHMTENVIKLRENGELCATWRLHGVPFETASADEVSAAKRQLVNFLHSIRGTDQSEPTAVWFHRVRRKVTERLPADFPSKFAKQLDDKWAARLGEEPMLRSELYMSLVLRPLEGVSRPVKRARTKDAKGLGDFDRDTGGRFENLCNQVSTSVAKYGGERLSTREVTSSTGNHLYYSDMLTFYKFLLTTVWEDVPLQQASIYNYLCDGRLFAGEVNGIVQVSHPRRKAFVGYLELQDYPSMSEPGMNNCLYFGGYEFIETQSFSFLSKREGVEAITLQGKRLISSGEGSPEQIEHMEHAKEDVRNGRVFMGEYHYSLGVIGSSVADTQLAMSAARTALQEEAGYKVVTSDVIPECAHFAQLPGVWKWRPRVATLTSRNFACLSPLHNFDLGKRRGNPWGDAIALLQTPSQQGMYLNFHDSPLGKDNLAEKLPGNVFICGMTGAGKSALVAFLLAQATKIQGLRILFFDKDRGGEAFIRAIGGRYRQLRRGQPTGFNPFQWEPTERNVKFVEKLVMQCAKRGNDDVLDVYMENKLTESVRRVFSLPQRQNRRISAILQFVGENSELGQRLAKWCRTQAKDGVNAWVFDNAVDTTDFSGCSVLGFDYTDFLDDPECGPVILSYILEAADTLINGDPFIYVMEEFAKMVAAKSQTLVEFSRDKQTTIRKLNGLGIFVTQSPSQVNKYPIGSTLREQCVTQIFLPNPQADYADYVDGFKLSPTEFEVIKELPLESRMFLVKQGHRSALCKLDLGGMRDELEIMSGTLDNVMLLDALRKDLNSDDPEVWMEPFLQRVRQRRGAAAAAKSVLLEPVA
jgi:type IV secretion system protein VirB4